MGAYSNPQGFVDTQTGQYYREITASIANAVSSIAQTYKQNQEEIRKINLKVGEEESALNRELSSTQQANPTVNFEDLYRPQIKRYAELRVSILNGTSKDPSADRMEADKIFSSVANIKNSLIDLSAEGFDEKYAKLGSPGGYAIDENNPSTMKAMLIFSNKLKGVKKGRFEDGDPNRFVWDIYDADNNLVATMSAEKIKQAANGNGLLYTIPDAEKPIIEVKKSNPTIFELEKGLPTGNVLEEYLVQGEVIEKEIPGGKTIQYDEYQRTVKQYRPMAKVDKDKIAADPNFNALVQSTATGLTGGDSGSGTDAILFHNTHFKKMEGFEPLDISKPLTPEQKEKFIEDYKKFTLATIPNEQIIPNANLIEKDVTEGFKPIDPEKQRIKDEAAAKKKAAAEAEKYKDESQEMKTAINQVNAIQPKSGPQKIKANGRTVVFDPSFGFKAEGVMDAFQTKEEVIAYLKGTPTKPALTVKK